MTIECYYRHCRFHSANEDGPDEGPFCFEQECKATGNELNLLSMLKQKDEVIYSISTNAKSISLILDKELKRTIPKSYQENPVCKPSQEPNT